MALSGNANDAARWSSTSVAGGLTLLMPTLAQIIGTSMNDDCTAEDAFRANQLDL